MVQVSVTAAVKAAGGPSLPLSLNLEPESYTLHSVSLSPKGGTQPTDKVPLPAGAMTLFAVSVRDAAEKPGKVDMQLVAGKVIAVDGSLLLANADVIAQLLTAPKREVSLENQGEVAVTVEILTCRSA